MKVKYSYKIINVDKETNSMEIVYTSEKYGVLHVGARLPWEGETVEQIVEMYNPSLFWLESENPVVDVTEGLEGEQSVDVLTPSEAVDPTEVDKDRLSLSKFQAFYSLASFGLLDKVDRLVRREGTLRFREAWTTESNKLDGPWAVRKCLEIVELIKLLGISSADMDAMFVRGSQLDINNPKESLLELESQLFDQEMIIWDRKSLLSETDYVEIPSYDKPKDDLVAQRQVWRDEIRDARNEIRQLEQAL